MCFFITAAVQLKSRFISSESTFIYVITAYGPIIKRDLLPDSPPQVVGNTIKMS